MFLAKGNKAGTRSIAGNHWNTWLCPESEGGKGKFTMGWQPNNKKLQMKTEEKDISNTCCKYCPLPQLPPLSTIAQTAQPGNSPGPKSFCPSDDGNPCFPAAAKA